jgi:hypothetical protein
MIERPRYPTVTDIGPEADGSHTWGIELDEHSRALLVRIPDDGGMRWTIELYSDIGEPGDVSVKTFRADRSVARH